MLINVESCHSRFSVVFRRHSPRVFLEYLALDIFPGFTHGGGPGICESHTMDTRQSHDHQRQDVQ